MKVKQGLMVVGVSLCTSNASFAAIVNTVTVTGTGPDGIVGGITATATESVDVVAADPKLQITKTGTITTGNDDSYADAGEEITYTFAVKNTGNVTLTDVVIQEEGTNAEGAAVVPENPTMHEDVAPSGDTTDSITTDAKWDVLAPGDTVHFTGNYTVIQTDIDNLQN